jgi:hypothetical protein
MTKKRRLEEECRKYNPDIDLEGSGEKDLGHTLADRIIQKYGKIENIPAYKNNPSLRKPLNEIITLSLKEIGNSQNADFLVRGYLQEAKNEGYNVQGFGKMNKTERWIYFLQFLRENDYK